MSQSQKQQLKRKRLRSYSLKSMENTLQNDFTIFYENIQYYFNISYEPKLGLISIKCESTNTSNKFETNLDFESLKKKSRVFSSCYNLDETFKTISNLFKNKKVRIEEAETKDKISLVLSVFNYIEGKEEDIHLILDRVIIKEKGNVDEISISKTEYDTTKLNIQNFFDIDIENKINTLFKHDESKEKQIAKLEKCTNELKIIHLSIKKELESIKNMIKFKSIKSDENDNSDEEEKEKEKEENIQNEENEFSDGSDYNSEEITNAKSANKPTEKNMEGSKEKLFTLKVKKLKEAKPNNENTSKSIPKMSPYKILTNKAICKYLGDNNFAVFKSLSEELFLVYATLYNSIHFYNIESEKVTKNIKNAHESEITNFRYTYDKNYNRDLLLSVSNQLKNIKVWDVNNLKCIVNIINAYSIGDVFSSCFLIDENDKKNYIISINYEQNLKIYDFEGTHVKEFDNSNDKSFLVDTFYNSKLRKYYIIVANEKFIISYNFHDGSIYNLYYEDNCNSWHMNFIISSNDDGINLIESDTFGYVRVWDFDKGVMLKKLFIERKMRLRGICLWNYKYLFVGADDKKIKLIDLENDVELDSLKCNDYVCTIKKVNCSKFGECLVFQGKIDHSEIKLWRNENVM